MSIAGLGTLNVHTKIGIKYSVATPKGRFTICKPANADGACQVLPSFVRSRKHIV